jgi:hypothetical protein
VPLSYDLISVMFLKDFDGYSPTLYQETFDLTECLSILSLDVIRKI